MTIRLLGRRSGLLFAGGLTPQQRAARYGLVAAWNLSEDSGARADAYGANALSDNNTVTSNPGIGGVGTAAQFTAANSEYLSIADNVALSNVAESFWGSGWFYLDTLPGGPTGAVTHWNFTGNNRGWAFDYDGPNSRFALHVSPDGTSTGQTNLLANTLGAPSTATWYHLFWYFDVVNQVIKIAGNGGAFDSVAHTTGVFDSTAPFIIGAYGSLTSTYWNGRIANVAFGKSPPGGIAARANEIRDYLYKNGAGRTYPGGWT